MKRILKGLLLAGWMLLIFSLSNQSGTASQELSDGILYRLALFISRFREIDIRSFVLAAGYAIRKAAHVFEYGVLYILAYEFLKEFGTARTALYGLLLCILYAFFDEFHQLFIDGRSGQLSDCLFDGSGSFLAFLLWHRIHKE